MKSFSRRLSVAFAILLAAFGLLVALLARQLVTAHEEETLQRLSHGLARNIVEHWPTVSQPAGDTGDRVALMQVLNMLMVVNPGIEVYVLDSEGRVRAYAGDMASIRMPAIDLAAVRAFLAGAPLPIHGSDPKGTPGGKLFSAAMLPARADGRVAGYLYVVLDGEQRYAVGEGVGLRGAWRTAFMLAAIALGATFLLGWLVFSQLTAPLRRLADRMARFGLPEDAAARPSEAGGDEVRAIEAAFESMAERIKRQARERAEQQEAHRDVIANVAHDLRTPLTALHGHLEALAADVDARGSEDQRQRLQTVLGQSEKVRRLSQQLFELASLQATHYPLHKERLRLDELVTDAVEKFVIPHSTPAVVLEGGEPGLMELEGDPQLIERALTNLIDNALRHAAGAGPVRVRLEREGERAAVLVEDDGAGLPAEIALRLAANRPVREPPLRRPGGGFGGLGLAIAQRIAWLHGGSLDARRAGSRGTQLCLALPLHAAHESASSTL
jgi:signal transduction histidine kinase